MKLIVLSFWLILFTLISASEIGIYERPGFLIKIFRLPFAVLYDLAQNSFLHLFGTPSNTLRGKDAPMILVPGPRDRCVWELTGYFEAKKSGNYYFRFRNSGITTFQIGAGRMCYEDVQESITEKIMFMDDSEIKVRLEAGRYYPLKIVHLSESMDLASYISINGGHRYTNLEEEVFQIQPNLDYTWPRSIAGEKSAIRGCPPMEISELGFVLGAYVYDKENDPIDVTYFRNGYEQLRKIINRPVYAYDGRIESHKVYPNFIADISGYLKPELEGVFTIRVSYFPALSIQIGKGVLQPETVYTIDDDWIFVDSRDHLERSIKLRKDFIYPFRIICMTQEPINTFDLNVTDDQGKEIDIFGLG